MITVRCKIVVERSATASSEVRKTRRSSKKKVSSAKNEKRKKNCYGFRVRFEIENWQNYKKRKKTNTALSLVSIIGRPTRRTRFVPPAFSHFLIPTTKEIFPIVVLRPSPLLSARARVIRRARKILFPLLRFYCLRSGTFAFNDLCDAITAPRVFQKGNAHTRTKVNKIFKSKHSTKRRAKRLSPGWGEGGPVKSVRVCTVDFFFLSSLSLIFSLQRNRRVFFDRSKCVCRRRRVCVQRRNDRCTRVNRTKKKKNIPRSRRSSEIAHLHARVENIYTSEKFSFRYDAVGDSLFFLLLTIIHLIPIRLLLFAMIYLLNFFRIKKFRFRAGRIIVHNTDGGNRALRKYGGNG